MLADLVGLDELAAVRRCEELALVGLLHGSARTTSSPTTWPRSASTSPCRGPRRAYHRRAADLLSGQPESMAAHAYAAGDRERAAHGWLLAGQAAMARSAVEDAIGLSTGRWTRPRNRSLRARALLARARAHEASTAYAAALTDIDEALALAARADRRLEMAALRARGGDVPVACGCRWPRWVRTSRLACAWPPGWATARRRRTSPAG